MRASEWTGEPEVRDELLGQRYRIVQFIARGGMAAVYRARDEHLGRDVALKVFHRGLTSPEDLRRQQAEVQHLARLTHPNLVTLYDAISDEGGRSFLVLEYVQGRDLRTRLRDGPLPLTDLAAIGRDIAEALAHIHGRNIVHRDLSPGNILVPARAGSGPDVAAKLTDLGIARVVDTGQTTVTATLLGTAAYLSPEQVRGNAVDAASDIYSLGLVLLECLTGKRAFSGPATESALARLNRDPEIPDHVPGEWRDLMSAMTARDPDRRPSAADVARQLADMSVSSGWVAAATFTAPLSGQTQTIRARSPVEAGRGLLAVATGLGLVALLVLVLVITALPVDQNAPTARLRYPAVPGRLGTHLSQLEHVVSPQGNQ